MRISDWSSDVCSSDLLATAQSPPPLPGAAALGDERRRREPEREVSPQSSVDNSSHRVLASLLSGAAEEAINRSNDAPQMVPRSEERRVGKECGSPCRFRWSTYH